ncbi:hypothetical protein V8U11_15970 [Pseudomonas chlororaphis]|uniref:hypothetical protein n=1 Tax=Pseudomonas chlororaphis TaxID=587753 RepID=UPI0030CC5097
MKFKQIACGISLGLILLFSGYAATGVHDMYDDASKIPHLIARVEKLEDSVIDLQVTQSKNQKDIIETIEQLDVTVDLLTRITEKTTGVKMEASDDDH